MEGQIEEITYTVDMVIPFVPKGATPEDGNDYLVTIKDVLKNGNYKAENGIASVGYTLDGATGTIEVPVTTISDTSESIVVPLDQFIKNADGVITNENADKTITLTYVATGKGSVIENTATPCVWGVDRTPSSFKVVTGKIQVTKLGATEDVKLKDAEFVIINKDGQFALLDGTNTLTVDTTVQPSKVYLQGGIDTVVTVSLQTLQLAPRVSTLDIDDDRMLDLNDGLQLDVMPIDKPALQLNDIGGAESAE